jgi:hypothetical protein
LELSVGLWKATAVPGDVLSTTTAGWQVTVEFDAVHCAVYCTYRRTRDAGLLPPPVTTIRFFAGGAAKAVIAVVDPAGTGSPRAAGRERAEREQPCTGGKRILVAALVVHGPCVPVASMARSADSAASVASFLLSNAPLRI